MGEFTFERMTEILDSERDAGEGQEALVAWISFATEDRFLGVAIIPLSENIPGPMHAVLAAHQTGISPGGSARITVFPASELPDRTPTFRLLQRHELRELGLIDEDA